MKNVTGSFLMLFASALFALESDQLANSEQVFSAYKDSVMQIRIIDRISSSKSAIGSGFVISKDGLVVTNFHVVSEWIYKPERYLIKYLINDSLQGDLRLLAIDVVHDLALLKADIAARQPFEFSTRQLQQGEHLYSFGNPHDIGLSIVEGTYNGYLEKSLYKKIHFTGSVNPGMSGGPVVDRDGNVVGVNVSGAGNQLSFLVPKNYVLDLLEKGRHPAQGKNDFSGDIHDQVMANQEQYMQPLLSKPLNAMTMDAYTLPGNLGDFMKCWGGTEKKEKQLFEQTYQICRTEDDIYLSPVQRTGVIEYEHNLYKSKGLGSFRFFSLIEEKISTARSSLIADEEMVSEFACQSGQVRHNQTKSKLVFCLRSYKKFKGLYDAWLTSVVLTDNDEVLQSSLYLSGVSYENSVKFAHAYLERLQWRE